MAKVAYHFTVVRRGEKLHAAVVSSEGWGAALRRLRRDDPVWNEQTRIEWTDGYELPRETGLQFSDRRFVCWVEPAHA